MDNPLLQEHILPPFDSILPKHIVPAIEQRIDNNLSSINKLLENSGPFTWQNLIEPIEELEDGLNKAWSPVSHMNSVVNSPELREAYQVCIAKLSDYSTKVGQNEKLYQAFAAIKEGSEYQQYSLQQKKVIDNALRDFKLQGVALEKDKKQQFANLSKQLSKLQSDFENNVLDATNGWHLDITDKQQLAGLPEQTIEMAAQTAEQAKVKGWRLGLDFPCYIAVMTYADNQQLRQQMHEAFSTRASQEGPDAGKWDNTQLMDEIIKTRYELAKLLDYKNFSEYSLVKKMAKQPQEVMGFLQDLADKAKPLAAKEFDELQEFAKQNYNVDKLNAWDLAYYSDKLKKQLFNISQEDLRPYFPLTKVLSGMFIIIHNLYGMQVKETYDAPLWHNDARFFSVYDKDNNLRGQFYIDLYARANKRGGAWMDEARVRRLLLNKSVQTPVAYVNCNFRAPVGDQEALLTHEDVETLFHEFGHGLHHILTKIDYADISGINGVPWDAVELPSQFFENWCWNDESIKLISSHYQTKKPLPAQTLKNLKAAKNFQSAMGILRQCEFALFDFDLHLNFTGENKPKIQQTLDRVREKYSVVPVPEYNRFQNSFSHIFAGGYAAGYYSYLWAEVLACDAFSLFEEKGIFDQQTGCNFLQSILEKGGSEEPMELFIHFRGREPSIEPLLQHHGLR